MPALAGFFLFEYKQGNKQITCNNKIKQKDIARDNTIRHD